MSANDHPFWTKNRGRGRPRRERDSDGRADLRDVEDFDAVLTRVEVIQPLSKGEKPVALAAYLNRLPIEASDLARAQQLAPAESPAFHRALAVGLGHYMGDRTAPANSRWARNLRRRRDSVLGEARSDLSAKVTPAGLRAAISAAQRRAAAIGAKTWGDLVDHDREDGQPTSVGRR